MPAKLKQSPQLCCRKKRSYHGWASQRRPFKKPRQYHRLFATQTEIQDALCRRRGEHVDVGQGVDDPSKPARGALISGADCRARSRLSLFFFFLPTYLPTYCCVLPYIFFLSTAIVYDPLFRTGCFSFICSFAVSADSLCFEVIFKFLVPNVMKMVKLNLVGGRTRIKVNFILIKMKY